MTMTRRFRTVVVAGAVGVLVVGATTAGLITGLVGAEEPAAPTEPETKTVHVTRGDLRQTQELPGELGYGTPITVMSRSEGIITWLPSAGVVVARGEELYRVDDSPVAILYGDLPMYRTLKDDGVTPLLSGRDVDLVAENLTRLGYYDGPTDGTSYGRALSDAVATWQEACGLVGTGVLAPTDVVVTRGPVRIEQVIAQVGGDAAGETMTLTSTEKIIVLQATPEIAKSLAPGASVLVTLVDGTRVRAGVVSLGQQAVSAEVEGPPTVPVTVEVHRPKDVARAALGPVTAQFTTASATDVLSVPVTALLALSGGGYALERPDETLVPVTLGMIVDGLVEVEGIEAGATVVIAA